MLTMHGTGLGKLAKSILSNFFLLILYRQGIILVPFLSSKGILINEEILFQSTLNLYKWWKLQSFLLKYI